jgi:hypothetical protein
MKSKILNIPQCEQITPYCCVPACLEQILKFHNIQDSQQIILKSLEYPERGMSIPQAGSYLLKHGFKTIINTNNIHIFDPAWFELGVPELIKQLKKRKKFVDIFNQSLIDDYLEYFKNYGAIKFETISGNLILKYLSKSMPIMAELASTYLYKKSKTSKPGAFNDSIKGQIEGHCVILAGFNEKNKIKIIDSNCENNPFNKRGTYWIDAEELIASIFILEGKSLLMVRNH